MPPVAPAPFIIRCIKSFTIVIVTPLKGPSEILPINIGSIEKSNWIKPGISGTGISKKYRTLAIADKIAVKASHLLLVTVVFIFSSFSYPDYTVGARITLARRCMRIFTAFADFTAGEEFHLPSKNYCCDNYKTIAKTCQLIYNEYAKIYQNSF